MLGKPLVPLKSWIYTSHQGLGELLPTLLSLHSDQPQVGDHLLTLPVWKGQTRVPYLICIWKLPRGQGSSHINSGSVKGVSRPDSGTRWAICQTLQPRFFHLWNEHPKTKLLGLLRGSNRGYLELQMLVCSHQSKADSKTRPKIQNWWQLYLVRTTFAVSEASPSLYLLPLFEGGKCKSDTEKENWNCRIKWLVSFIKHPWACYISESVSSTVRWMFWVFTLPSQPGH